MLEQKSQAVTFLFEFLDSAGLGITGVSAFVAVSRLGAAAILTLAEETAATEVDSTNHPGLYKYTLASGSTGTADSYVATAVWQSGGTPACKTQRALWVVGQPWIEHVDADITDPVTIANDAINAASIAANAISATRIADGAITAAKIAADAITSSTIATGAIDATALATGAIHATAIATDAINAAAIKADAVTKIQAGLSPSGSGDTPHVYPADGDPITVDDVAASGVTITITRDLAGAVAEAGPQVTNASGYVASPWMLDAGTTFYAWRSKDGVTFENPYVIEVPA